VLVRCVPVKSPVSVPAPFVVVPSDNRIAGAFAAPEFPYSIFA
jgi:hypothetical protein